MPKIILNEQHTLMEDQKRLLNEKFGENEWEIYPVPAKGWTKDELWNVSVDLRGKEPVFASPIPALMKFLAFNAVVDQAQTTDGTTAPTFYVLHNDNREKKELPNGKIIMTVAQTGWELI